MLNNFLSSIGSFFNREKPKHLLFLFIVFSFVSSLVVLLITGFGIFRIYSNSIIKEAENDAKSIGRTVIERERDMIMSTGIDGSHYLKIDKDIKTLDENIKKYLHPFSVFKVKIFSPDRKIIYSTDHKIIGMSDEKNKRLEDALKGKITSHLKKEGEVWDLEGEIKYDVDVVETYLPIYNSEGKVIGVYELYTDISAYREEIRAVLISSMTVITGVLFLAMAGLFLIMRAGVRKIEDAQRKIEKIAITDDLTGLFNRMYIMNRLESEFSKMKRIKGKGLTGNSIGLIMLDIDYFKVINDVYGHLAGDKVLTEIALRLRSAVRDYDLIGRYGGEEFLIILPNSGIEETMLVAERLWQGIREYPFEISGNMIHITVSIGISCIYEDDESIDKALKLADDRLYTAKRSGRDRIVSM